MDFGIEGKVAMVAAASKGIGLAVAQELAAEGCSVSICARSESGIEAALKSLPEGTLGFVADVTSPNDLGRWVARTRSELGDIDILVTNTGGPPAGPVSDMTDEQWQAGFDSTLMNVVRLTRLVKDSMAERGWGRIVHITSLVAKEPSANLPISSTLRAGLMALTKLQALDLAPSGVTVNAVLPGHTDTDRQQHLIEIRAERDKVSVEEAKKRQIASLPMARFARPDEIAAAVAFLCSDRASYLTGISLLVDGGATRAP